MSGDDLADGTGPFAAMRLTAVLALLPWAMLGSTMAAQSADSSAGIRAQIISPPNVSVDTGLIFASTFRLRGLPALVVLGADGVRSLDAEPACTGAATTVPFDVVGRVKPVYPMRPLNDVRAKFAGIARTAVALTPDRPANDRTATAYIGATLRIEPTRASEACTGTFDILIDYQ